MPEVPTWKDHFPISWVDDHFVTRREFTKSLVWVSLATFLANVVLALLGRFRHLWDAEALPQVPTIAESGVPDYQINAFHGILAPAGTPPAIVAQLNKALNAALADDAVIKRIRQEGAEPEPITPQQYAADIDAEETRWSAVVKELGIVGN